MHIERIERLDELESPWRSIEAARPAFPVFQSWLWNGTWARTVLPATAGARLRCWLVSCDAGRPLAIVPCFGRRLAGGALSITQWLGNRMSSVGDVVTASPQDDELARELLAALQARLAPREVVHLKHLDAGSAFARAAVERGLAEIQCRRLVVSREDGNDPMARLGRKSRRTLHWQTNRLRREHGSCTCRVAAASEAEAAFERFVAFHHARFDRRRARTLVQGASLAFLRTVFLELCRQGRAEILELVAGERPMAALLGILDQGRYYSVNSGFDPSFERYSPMKLLLTEGMRRAFALGCERFELGTDSEPYKQTWRPRAEISFAACLAGPGVIARVGASGYRAAFRRVSAGTTAGTGLLAAFVRGARAARARDR